MSFVRIHGKSQIKDNTIDISKLEPNFLSGSNWFINSNSINKATITTIPDPISVEDVANKRYVDLKSTIPLLGLNDILVGNGAGYSTLKLTAGTGISISNTPGNITISSTTALNFQFYDHQKIGSGITGTIDGINAIFSLDNVPDLNSVHVYINGLLQDHGIDNQYYVLGNSIIFNLAPEVDDVLTVSYRTTN